jgi:hypothetical protein
MYYACGGFGVMSKIVPDACLFDAGTAFSEQVGSETRSGLGDV